MSDFERIERLGEGNFGEVWLVYDKALNVHRAVKYIRPSRVTNPTKFYQEPHILMELRHENIVRVEDAGKDKNGNLYISMEYLSSGSLENKYKARPIILSLCKKYLCDVCWGLEYAHQSDYIHRDIKPANILIGNKGEGKLSDFGLAARTPPGMVASPFGYLTHLAPETFTKNITNKLTDVYALGVTAYRMTNGDAFLPTVNTMSELEKLIIKGHYPDRSHYRPYVPRQFRIIINKAMNVNATARYQSASLFRRDLEKMMIYCDWKWKTKRTFVKYKTHIDDLLIEVKVIRQQTNKFNLETRKGYKGSCIRRVSKFCFQNLNLVQMKSKLHRILSNYVVHGK